MYILSWGTQGGGMTVCAGLSLFCLPQTGFCTLLWASEAPFLSWLISLLARGLLRVQEPFLFFSSLPGLQSCPSSSIFFFFPFILPGYEEIVLVLWGVWGLLLVFSRCSVRIVPFVDVFLMYLWEEVRSMSFYSSILILLSYYLVLSVFFVTVENCILFTNAM